MVGGLRSILSEFFIAVSQEKYSVIILTETWLHRHISNAELFNGNYQIYRKDRYTDSINKGGSVLIAINSLISSKFIELEDNSIEQICVCLQNTSGNIYIIIFIFSIVIYRPKVR